MIHVTKENFNEEIVESKTPVIIDFYADWCMPCKMMAPVFERLSGEYDGKLKFVKVDTQENPELAVQFSIQGIPALVITKDGKEINRIVGFAGEQQLKERIDLILSDL